MAFGFWSIPCKKIGQPLDIYPEKTFTPYSLRLWVNPPRKAPPAFGDIPRKNVYARPPPAAFSHRSRGSPSGPLRRLEKVQLQTAFGFWSISRERSRQRSEIYPEKTLRLDGLRLWIYTEQKVSPAFGDIPRKNVYVSPPPAAFSHRPRGSPSGLLR